MSTKRMSVRNTLFPGRPNYTGPTKGWFGFLHHEQLCEQSHDVNKRIHYVKREKPKNEVAIRLHNMIYLGGCEATTKRDALYADYKIKHDALYAAYTVKRDALDAEILAYIKSNIPDCAWNGKTLVFP